MAGPFDDLRPRTISEAVRAGASAGALLRRWRHEAGVSQAQLAHRLSVAKSTVSQWESDLRSIGALPHDIDVALDADGAFTGMRWGLTSENALEPSRTWIHNLTGSGTGPVWAWLRHLQPVPVTVRFSWGDWAGAAQVPTEGLVLTSPVSLSGPPIVFRLSAPGWVDVGNGVFPEWFGVNRLDATQLLSDPPLDASYFFRLLGSRLRDDLVRSGRTAAELAEFLGLVVVPAAIADPPNPAPLVERLPATKTAPGARFTLRGADATRVRRARSLSRPDVVRLANELPGLPDDEHVSPHWLRALEAGDEPRHPPNALGRLDLVLGGCGRLVCIETSVARTGRSIRTTLPSWWVGPVWFEIEPVGRVALTTVWIRWRGYARGLVLNASATVACTKVAPTEELPTITADAPVTVTAGIGACDQAADINRYWFPEAGSAVDGLFDQAMEMILSQRARTLDDYRRFVQPMG